VGAHLTHFILSSLKPFRWGSACHGLFNYFTYPVNFIRALFIDFLILSIGMFIEVSILKAYFSQYHTPLDHHMVVQWSEYILSLFLTISLSQIIQEGQYISFLKNIEFGSLCFYLSLLHRGILTIVIPLMIMLIQ
jgi:hypothetical protein